MTENHRNDKTEKYGVRHGVVSIEQQEKNRATGLIEDCMIASNQVEMHEWLASQSAVGVRP